MLKLIFYLIFLCINLNLIFVTSQNFEKSRSVWVEQGLVRGKIYKFGIEQVQIFRGVPYAEPPVGDLRFKVCFTLARKLSPSREVLEAS